jgi:type I restriction enzyme M protein
MKKDELLTVLWSHYQALMSQGLTAEEYAQQLTYLLFLKIADEMTESSSPTSIIPRNLSWQSLVTLRGQELLNHYSVVLRTHRSSDGLAGVVFRNAEPTIKVPEQLEHLISVINRGVWHTEEETPSPQF